jgi:dephospho-CoA kinase
MYMLKVGLTGGIGAGKSVVARLFQVIHIPAYDADSSSKRLMLTHTGLKQSIIENFGEESYKDGQLNRQYLAATAFSDKSKLELLNQLVHPVTLADAQQWFAAQDAPYAIKEAALFFESGTAEGLDYMIGVTAPLALRIKRVMQRDQISESNVKERMKHQLEDSLKMKLCDFVVHNDEQEMIIPQVLNIHHLLIELSKKERSTS